MLSTLVSTTHDNNVAAVGALNLHVDDDDDDDSDPMSEPARVLWNNFEDIHKYLQHIYIHTITAALFCLFQARPGHPASRPVYAAGGGL